MNRIYGIGFYRVSDVLCEQVKAVAFLLLGDISNFKKETFLDEKKFFNWRKSGEFANTN